MSESEIATTSTSSRCKKMINSQTQHGNAMTADEENIVVLGQSFSPIRETSDEVVWHEDVIKQEKDDEDVSKIFNYFSRRF